MVASFRNLLDLTRPASGSKANIKTTQCPMVEFLRPVVGGSCVLPPGLVSCGRVLHPATPPIQVNQKRLLAVNEPSI